MVGFDRPRDFTFGTFSGPEPKLGEILEKEVEVSDRYRLTGHLWRYLRRYAAKHEAAGNGFGFGLVGPEISPGRCPLDISRTAVRSWWIEVAEGIRDG